MNVCMYHMHNVYAVVVSQEDIYVAIYVNTQQRMAVSHTHASQCIVNCWHLQVYILTYKQLTQIAH